MYILHISIYIYIYICSYKESSNVVCDTNLRLGACRCMHL